MRDIFVDSESVGKSIHDTLDAATRWLAQVPAAALEEDVTLEPNTDVGHMSDDGNHTNEDQEA